VAWEEVMTIVQPQEFAGSRRHRKRA
jgi:serine/threonine protein phosphatase 1